MPKNNVDANSYSWLKTKNLENAYFIGGDAVLDYNVLVKINGITSNNVLNNRVYGSERQDTNAKVIEKFYTNSNYEKIIVTKRNPLVDALTAGPLAAKLKSPIVIVGESVSQTQKNVLEPKKSNLVYDVGGGLCGNEVLYYILAAQLGNPLLYTWGRGCVENVLWVVHKPEFKVSAGKGNPYELTCNLAVFNVVGF